MAVYLFLMDLSTWCVKASNSIRTISVRWKGSLMTICMTPRNMVRNADAKGRVWFTVSFNDDEYRYTFENNKRAAARFSKWTGLPERRNMQAHYDRRHDW